MIKKKNLKKNMTTASVILFNLSSGSDKKIKIKIMILQQIHH